MAGSGSSAPHATDLPSLAPTGSAQPGSGCADQATQHSTGSTATHLCSGWQRTARLAAGEAECIDLEHAIVAQLALRHHHAILCRAARCPVWQGRRVGERQHAPRGGGVASSPPQRHYGAGAGAAPSLLPPLLLHSIRELAGHASGQPAVCTCDEASCQLSVRQVQGHTALCVLQTVGAIRVAADGAHHNAPLPQ